MTEEQISKTRELSVTQAFGQRYWFLQRALDLFPVNPLAGQVDVRVAANPQPASSAFPLLYWQVQA